ncbi:exported hypothetical protein [uncultured Alphaproteobacteria bacterium]|uniref:Uncharacterized protein n=1 Tax=uncultured Alphaproteobacteria bacterium TaxID=91750 RepID=A0A212J3I4_9PROT|nr:exported hypothetical protein [uncultured Alphaproteobacteria bacterium]
MPKIPRNWPASVLPRRLTKEWAAFYCGVSTATFDAMVKARELPNPDERGKYDLRMLDIAIDRRNGLTDDSPDFSADWSVKRRASRN